MGILSNYHEKVFWRGDVNKTLLSQCLDSRMSGMPVTTNLIGKQVECNLIYPKINYLDKPLCAFCTVI